MTNSACNTAKYWQCGLVLSCPTLFLSPSHRLHKSISYFFPWSEGACYSSSNSTWQGDLCPTQDELKPRGWKGWGSHVPCPTLWSVQHSPLPRPHSWPARREREALTAACPLMLGPLLDSGEGKETKAGRGRSNTHQKLLFTSMPNLTENVHS